MSKNLHKSEIVEIVQSALRNEYGFQPPKKDIVLLEASGNGTYAYFRVGAEKYVFYSDFRHGEENGVWTGKGTIEKE